MERSNNSLQFTDNQQVIQEQFTEENCIICYEAAGSPPEDERNTFARIVSDVLSFIENPWESRRKCGLYYHNVRGKPSHSVHSTCYRDYLKSIAGTTQRPKCLGCNVPKLVPKEVIPLGEKLHPLTLSFCKNVVPFVFAYLSTINSSDYHVTIPIAFFTQQLCNANPRDLKSFYSFAIIALICFDLTSNLSNLNKNHLLCFFGMEISIIADLYLSMGIRTTQQERVSLTGKALLQFLSQSFISYYISSFPLINSSVFKRFFMGHTYGSYNEFKMDCKDRYEFVARILVENKEEIQQKTPGCMKRSVALSVRVTTFAWNYLFRCMHAFYPMEPRVP